MSKERLEEFKDYIDFLDDSADMEDYHRFIDTLKSLYADGELGWIYRYAKEQAERVQELEDRHYRQELIDEHIERLEQQNKHYRESIQEAMELNHDENFNYDVDKVLLKALESGEE